MSPAPTAARLPETMTPREIGAHMARLREQFGLTAQEVSERLHIRARYVGAMEEGRYDLLPGKVYARGYVHTYAEFLGLEAEWVVAQCFADDLPAAPAKLPHTRRSLVAASGGGRTRHRAILVAVAVLVLLIMLRQPGGTGPGGDAAKSGVAPVPEALLASVRTMVMPTAGNHACLTTDTLLGCFFADNTTRALAHLGAGEPLRFGGDVDVSSMAVPLPEAAKDGEKPAPGATDE